MRKLKILEKLKLDKLKLEKLKIQKKESDKTKSGSLESKPNNTDKSAINKDSKEPIIAEYHETIYSEGESYEFDSTHDDIKHPIDQRIWRDVNAIEENVDNISKYKSEIQGEELNKKVDSIISKIKDKKSKKPSNVIYVVSKPQPGQVKGDWAVRSHGKIYSHHRKKEIAIKKARIIARERNATVLIQNIDGTFSEGFKPRMKK
jgi:hypothetical protein